jgi:uncharacterized membrane protein
VVVVAGGVVVVAGGVVVVAGGVVVVRAVHCTHSQWVYGSCIMGPIPVPFTDRERLYTVRVSPIKARWLTTIYRRHMGAKYLD